MRTVLNWNCPRSASAPLVPVPVRPGEGEGEAWCRHLQERPADVGASVVMFYRAADGDDAVVA